jgi:hypothetical protein
MKRILFLLLLLATLLVQGAIPVSAQGPVTESLDVSLRVVETTVAFEGYTIPNAVVTFSNYGIVFGTVMTDSDGYFFREFTPLVAGPYQLEVFATAPDGVETERVRYNLVLGAKEYTEIDVVIPPSLFLVEGSYPYNGNILVSGFGRPNFDLTLEIDGPSSGFFTLRTDANGYFTHELQLDLLRAGDYEVRAYFDPAHPSFTRRFTIGPLPTDSPTPPPTATPLPGPSATPGPTTPGPTDAPAATAVPFRGSCPFRYDRLCRFDRDSDVSIDTRLELNTYLFDFASLLDVASTDPGRALADLFDIDGNGIVEARDLSIVLANTSFENYSILDSIPRLTDLDRNKNLMIQANQRLQNIRSNVDTNLRIAVTAGLTFAVLTGTLILAAISRTMGGPGAISIAGYAVSVGLFLRMVVAFFGQNPANIAYRIDGWREDGVSITAVASELETVSFTIYVTSREDAINAASFDILYDPRSLSLVSMETEGSFASIFTHRQYSDRLGYARVVGGVPGTGFVGKGRFVTLVFARKEDAIQSIRILPNSHIYLADGDGSDVFGQVPIDVVMNDTSKEDSSYE